MMGNFIYSANLREKDGQHKSAPNKKIDKIIIRIIIFFPIIVFGGLLWFFCITPCIMPASIDVSKINGLSKTDLLQWAGIANGASYITVNAQQVETRLATHHLVASARVDKIFPNKISIYIKPRQAIGFVFAKINNKILPAYFDREGVIFHIGNEAENRMETWLPVVSGIYDERYPVRLGAKFASAYLPLFTRMGMINDASTSIWKEISEIKVVNRSKGIFDIVLYPLHYKTRILMNSDINSNKIYYALINAEIYEKISNVSDIIDLRSGIGVVDAR
ncbi:MAG: FtsQ-type POTRA domain-containing protein [Treponema sp.]|nr:FtsQ-type POTRA domain-containing protein [Treponema sp.]